MAKKAVCGICGHEWDVWEITESSLCCPKCKAESVEIMPK
jgi:predicted Zn-ribbon and HTH transcriptional regulator